MSCLVMAASFPVDRDEADTTAAQVEGNGENVVLNSERDISHPRARSGGDGENGKINSWCGIRDYQGPA